MPAARFTAVVVFPVPPFWLRMASWRARRVDAKPGWLSAQWTIEAVSGTPYYRIRNRWKPEQFLHIEHGRLASGPIESGWHSAMWTIEPGDEGARRIRNRWKNQQYIHIERGRVEAGPIQPGWWSAQWYLKKM